MTSPHASLVALIPRLRTLLVTGFTAAVANEGDGLALLRYLAHPLEAEDAGDRGDDKGAINSSGWIISQRLLAVRPTLASDAELLCALLAQQMDVRAAWLTLAAARCKEAGQMANSTTLVELISGLGPAATWVEAALESALLTASPYAAFERELLGMSFEQAAATPALVRILAVAAQLATFVDALPPLPKVDASGVDAQKNWGTGRLLALPFAAELSLNDQQKSANTLKKASEQVLLQGGITPVITEGQTVMDWVLAQPWVLLLAMLSYAQDAWRAENRGGLLLELPAGQNAFAPAEIAVTVMGAEGDEVRCGTLAHLLLDMLARLGVTCFPQQPTAAALNAQLSPLVGLMLKHSIWRYQDGASSQLGQYQIHPHFSDQCYSLRARGVFSRTGKLLWQSARLAAEAQYQEHKQIYQHRSVREPEAEYVVQGEPIA